METESLPEPPELPELPEPLEPHEKEGVFHEEDAGLGLDAELILGPSDRNKTLKYVLVAVAVLVALLSFFAIAPVASSPEAHSGTIQSLDQKKDTVLGLVAASTGTSAAVTLLPGDTCTPIAEKLVDLSSDFLVVLAAIYLEKYLLTILGLAAFRVLIPLACLMVIAALLLRTSLALRQTILRLGAKFLLFGICAFLLVPVIGVVSWQCAAAAVTGFIAKENVVGTIATCFAITNFIDTEELALVGDGNAVATMMALTKVAALAFLMFNLYTPPCFAALGAMRSEMQSKKWFWGAVCFQLATGYTVGFLVYQIGTLITTGALGAGFLGGLIAVLCFAGVIAYLIIRNNRSFDAEYQLD